MRNLISLIRPREIMHTLIVLKKLFWWLLLNISSDQYSSAQLRPEDAVKFVLLMKLSGQELLPELKNLFPETCEVKSVFFLMI